MKTFYVHTKFKLFLNLLFIDLVLLSKKKKN